MPQMIMPKMGDGMDEGTLLRWLKNVGEEVQVGDPIAEIETDKVTLEIEATESGVLTRTLIEEGATVPIGTPIASIGEDSGEAPAAAAVPAEAPAAAAAPAAAQAAVAAPPAPPVAPVVNGATAPAPVRPSGERMRASPLVKRLSAEHGIDLNQVPGTGPGGRIVKDDLGPYLTGAKVAPKAAPAAVAAPSSAAAPVAASADGGRQPGIAHDLSRIRKTTGKRMLESKTQIPHFYVSSEIDMGPAMAFREKVNAQITDDASKVSFNDLVIKATANALREFPGLNQSYENDQLVEHPNIDINVAVAIEGGLIAPFIADADRKTLGAIARSAKDLIGRARNGGLQPSEYQGGTFTISNLGMFDVSEFIAIINPPQAAILAIGSIAEVPVVKNGKFKVGHRMTISISADHRVTDGAEVARFLQAVKRNLQNPMLMLVS